MGAVRVEEIVRSLWNLCSVLRDEGVTYHEYLSELTFPLFLKLAADLPIREEIPDGCQWGSLRDFPQEGKLSHYRETLRELSLSADERVAAIFAGAATRLRSDAGAERLLSGIDDIDWGEISGGTLGDVYEGLIQKSAQESRYGAGQYFTPRPLVEAMVAVTRPSTDDIVLDPATGTGGFLVTSAHAVDTGQPTLIGVELASDVHRLALMNVMLHGLSAEVRLGDALSFDQAGLDCTICLTNPPFGVKGNVMPAYVERLQFPTSSKQLAFVQLVFSSLRPGGRAAVVVPDNVLFEGGVAGAMRTHLLDNFNVHTVLRLPSGIFYATGIKTSVIFFEKPTKSRATAEVWFYDLRNGSRFTKRRSLQAEDFSEFIECYGADPNGRSPRTPSERFQAFDRDQIRRSGDRLDLGPKEDQSPAVADTPAALLGLLQAEMEAASTSVGALMEMLKSTTDSAE